MNETRDWLNTAFLRLPGKPFFAAKRTESSDLRQLLDALAPVQTTNPLIRLGPVEDGGYLVPDDLEGIAACFSPGVSIVSGFELDCANRGINVFMADASVDAPPNSHSRFKFIKKFIGSCTQGEFITMEGWIEAVDADPATDWILQMDIEGAEYEALLSLPERYLNKFRILVVEFHSLDYLFDANFSGLAASVFRKILHNHACVHIHPNNAGSVISSSDFAIPKIMEFTFYRKDRGITEVPVTKFPHPLDFQCVPQFPAINLPACWHR